MSTTKLIRHNMAAVGPPPAGTTQEQTTDRCLIKGLLVAKAHEEVQEVAKAQGIREISGELADLYEVWYALCRLHRLEPCSVMELASLKADERGPLLMTSSAGDVAIIHRVEVEQAGG